MRHILLFVGLSALVTGATCVTRPSDTDALHAGTGGSAAEGAGGGALGGSGSGASAHGGGSTGGAGGGSVGGAGGVGSGAGGTGQGGAGCSGPSGQGASGPCEFPQGVPEEDFIASACSFSDTDPTVDAAVNAVMVALTGCAVSSDCPLSGFPGTTVDEICQSFFAAVTAELRAQGFCAGQHSVGSTDEIAVSNTGCGGKWFGYHICNYGGPKVVWNPGARRGWWAIDSVYCP